jgi:NAD-dependent dihydropyrimidine dehydrogenase PreA subunit
MQRDRSTYTGLPRNEIDWFPRIDAAKCNPQECNYRCVSFCPFKVFARQENGAVTVAQPYECNVGDESCKFQCPLDAISFPSRAELKEMLRQVRAKYQPTEG